MKAYFIDIITQAVRFIFVDLNSSKYIRDFKHSNGKMDVFTYFDQISELFLVSMIDIYSFITKGLTDIRIFKVQQPTAQVINKPSSM